ncbi:hypothetical protein F4Z99_10790 [Candidatus Poribacteria bacterium]|nr:hypothetical protein [Candidatus Poribacteria bacterium]MYB01123.1 hypothetical protein [Candidatus Poribacteria bacterium]
MYFPKTSQIQRGVVGNQERSETQLHTVRGPETAKALGFSPFSVAVPSLVSAESRVPFQVLRISVQPNLQDYKSGNLLTKLFQKVVKYP